MNVADAVFALAEQPARTAVLMDFDGTLAAIVDHPDDAVPVPGVVELLQRLVEVFGVVGIVSGRPVAFLREAIPVAELALVGQYGMERWDGTQVAVDPDAMTYEAAIGAVARRAEAELPGIFVERKGIVAVTLHWRRNPGLGEAVQAWADGAAIEHGLTLYPTKMAVELRPPVAVDKGAAAADLTVGMEAAVFGGDDHGDLSAFAALGRLRSTGDLARVVRVAVRSSEMPAELVARADVAVDGPLGMVAFLNQLGDAAGAGVSARG